MDDCRRCGAPLTDNGCEYCGDGRPAEHRYSLDVARQELDRAAAWRYSTFAKGLTKSVDDSNRTAFMWHEVVVYGLVLAALTMFVIGKARTPERVAERGGIDLKSGQVAEVAVMSPIEFVSVGTSSFGIDVNAGLTNSAGTVNPQHRLSFYHRRTSH